MKGSKLFAAMSDLDDDLIFEAEQWEGKPRRPLRRLFPIAAVVAVVMMLMVSAVAQEWTASTSWLIHRYGQEENTGYMYTDERGRNEIHNVTMEVCGREISCTVAAVYNTGLLQHHTVCEGETVKTHLEAMVLMADEQVLYKEETAQGDGQVIVVLDNQVNGEPGTIVHVRAVTTVQTLDGWQEVYSTSAYLPTSLHFSIPSGIDTRFPDMQYNYDGRWEPSD